MKRITFLIILMLCSIASIAQTANEHLTFKGVPIDGSLNEYVTKMKTAGFSYLGMEDGTAILQGDFAGVKECLVIVSTLTDADIVNTISVMFPEKKDWSSLEENYQCLKGMLREKYGKPSDCVEKFQGYTSSMDNRLKLHYLEMDRCTYTTVFETPKGIIQLSLAHKGVSSCFVKLQYWDKINTEAVRAKAMDDL